MKKSIKILFVIIALTSYCSYSQVVTAISQVFVNSQTTVSNCSLIDFATTSNNSITVYYKLTKPLSQAVSGNITLQLKYSSSSNGTQKASIPVQAISWVDNTQTNTSTFESTISCNISESEIQVTGSSIYAEFATSSNIKTSSCEYSLKKTPLPSFSFSPTSLNLSCGDISARTFTVTPANIPNGANVTYQWNYSGWSGTVNSSMNSVTLTPTSGTSLPLNVSVTPYINGAAYPSKTCTISRSSIASNGSISGNTTVCTTRTYTLTGLLSSEFVNWSLSNATAGTLSTTTGNSTIFTATGSGSVDIMATVSNTCGESYTKTLSLFAGSPPSFSLKNDLYENQSCDIKYHYVPFIIKKPVGVSLSFEFLYPNASYTATSLGNNDYRYTFAFNKSYSGYFNVNATFTNSCGSSYFETEGEYYIQSCDQIQANNNLNNTENSFVIFPNPASDILTIELKDSENQLEKDATISGELFDMFGQSKSKIEISDNKATFSVKGLKKGIYILKIYVNDQVENHQIAVE
ncbi:T9SS type A sorting domain-containing protein [Flavobacterium soyangense]|uniref:T9SS type A sorting domain-containing protein n=1 Tax=Flavobacterium soyangense TaxID=2023265 RepID=A0A930U883_9FLAO|nr:T9SS type A sorting domain-containing protein [Flavobacterium soyangense]MBF2708718.1 T9SS type A sorting domain-containing protein [Flavobacterium soyangense]